MRGGRGRKRRRNLGGHVVEGDTFVTGDAVFLWVVVKGREDEDMTGFNGIKEAVGGFVVITEAVIGKEDDVMTFGKKDYEDFLLFVGYKGRDHDGALTSVFDASVHVISEGFVIAIDGHFDPLAMDMNGRVTEMLEDVGIADSAKRSAGDLDAFLHTEELGILTFGSKTLRVHVDILIGSRELAILSHRADMGHLGEYPFFEFRSDTIRRNRRKSLRGVGRKSMRSGRENLAAGFLGTLPETADSGEDALWHLMAHIPDRMKMVGHEAIVEHLNLGMVLGHFAQAVEDGFA